MKERDYPPKGTFYMYPQYDEDNELFGFTTDYEGEGAFGRACEIIVNEDLKATLMEKAIDENKSLIKEWELGNSAEAKYKVEAYKELIELIEKEDKE